MKPFVPIIIILMLFSSSFVGMSYTAEKSSHICESNNPPYVPSNPIPPNGSTNVTTIVYLCWTGGDPDGDEVFYNVYFGNTSPPPGYLYNQSNNCTPVLYLLEFNTTYYWKIISIDEHGASTEGPIWSFTTGENDPPNMPSNPNPGDGETGVPINTCITWDCEDPDGDNVYYDVYFGEDPFNLTIVSNNQSSTTYCPEDILEFATTYYWMIIAWDKYGYSTSGPTWSFTTETNLPPYAPYDLKPEDGADNVPININLSWKGGDPNIGDTVIYDLYFEESDSDPSYMDTIGPYNATKIEIIYHLSFDLELFKTYYWKIVATDSHGLKNTSAVYSFTTGINYPPGKPTIKGSNSAKVNIPYECTVTAIDPDGDNVSYEIDWADGEISDWTTWYLSGEEVSMSHLYSEKAFCEIKARAKDIYGAIGEWGEWRLVISKDKLIYNLLFFKFLKSMFQFPLLEWLLESLMWRTSY